MLELLVSGDAVVPDYDAAVARCQREWGLPEVHPRWVSAPPGAGAKWCFARLQRDRRLAPTAFEVLGIPYRPPAPDDRPAGYAYLPEIAAAQGERPARHHSTVVSATDVLPLADRIRDAGGECRVDPPDEHLPFPRLWVGFSAERPGEYDPSTDGGIRLEVIPHQPLAMPTPEPEHPQPPLEPGAPVRMVGRTLLVADLDATLGALDRNLDWRPSSLVTGDDGVRRARFSFPYPRSAVLELAQPGDAASAEGQFLVAWGPGPFSVRIAVHDLGALEERLTVADVPHRALPPVTTGEPPRLFRPPERGLGTGFEFVEDASPVS